MVCKKLTNLIDKLMRDYTYSNINSSVETCIEKAIETQNLKKMRFTYALKGAELGDPEMQYLVAELYYSQSGTDDDSYNDCAYKRAIYWYNKAIEQNYAKAMSGLAGIYEFGCSGPGGCIEQDREKALELYRKGAELGDVASQNSLNRFNEQPIVISAREPSSFGIGGFLKGLFK